MLAYDFIVRDPVRDSIRDVVRMSIHAIQKDFSQFAGQLFARLRKSDTPEIESLAADQSWVLAVATNNSNLELWDLITGEMNQRIMVEGGSLSAVCISSCEKYRILCFDDCSLELHGTAQEDAIATFTFDRPITYCDISADGNTVNAGDAFGFHVLMISAIF